MKVTIAQLKQLIKEELQEATGRIHDDSTEIARTEAWLGDAPEWYLGQGGVADRLQEMANQIRDELDEIKTRLDDVEKNQ